MAATVAVGGVVAAGVRAGSERVVTPVMPVVLAALVASARPLVAAGVVGAALGVATLAAGLSERVAHQREDGFDDE